MRFASTIMSTYRELISDNLRIPVYSVKYDSE